MKLIEYNQCTAYLAHTDWEELPRIEIPRILYWMLVKRYQTLL